MEKDGAGKEKERERHFLFPTKEMRVKTPLSIFFMPSLTFPPGKGF
jgi:hypothetical protein